MQKKENKLVVRRTLAALLAVTLVFGSVALPNTYGGSPTGIFGIVASADTEGNDKLAFGSFQDTIADSNTDTVAKVQTALDTLNAVLTTGTTPTALTELLEDATEPSLTTFKTAVGLLDPDTNLGTATTGLNSALGDLNTLIADANEAVEIDAFKDFQDTIADSNTDTVSKVQTALTTLNASLSTSATSITNLSTNANQPDLTVFKAAVAALTPATNLTNAKSELNTAIGSLNILIGAENVLAADADI